MSLVQTSNNEALDIHRGAIDQTTITTQPPSKVMQRVGTLLRDMGVRVQEESAFRFRCIRVRKGDETPSPPTSAGLDLNSESTANVNTPSQSPKNDNVLYGSPAEESAEEVRFTVELTRLAGLNDTYSLDIRRLKGNLRSYKYIYDTIRERAELNR